MKRYPAPYAVTSWPEDLNRTGPEIDAYAEATGAPPLAIEVRKIESFEDQRFDDAQILALAQVLEPELGPIFPTGVDVWLNTASFKKGFDWADAQIKLRDYLRDDLLPRLKPGRDRYAVPGVPFEIVVSYQPGLRTAFAVGRFSPTESDRKKALTSSVEKALRHKAARLDDYRAAGARSVLIMESHDIALISHVNVYGAFVSLKTENATHLDDVWFCRTAGPRLDEWYLFRGSEEQLNRINLPNLRLGPRHDQYWELALAEGRV